MKQNVEVYRIVVCLAVVTAGSLFTSHRTSGAEPRIVNIYNFIRNSDYRVMNSEDVLFETTRQEIDLVKKHKLHGTWALQYDALINPRYQVLLKEQLVPADEIAAWWEIPRQLAEKAGIKWRGAHDWDSTANVGFSPGYTPDERRKIVDVYMTDFKAAFGYYPKTVGSWYIDEVTLAYMADRYGIVASCNCKDQVGTDGYTLWGGYWNQAYYPSKVNAYMPAQNKESQLNIPIFRMLGSDPIYQFPNTSSIYSLEPVYAKAGGSSTWVDWFTSNLVHEPCLAFGYTQAGQENSFGWHDINNGLTMQMGRFAKQAEAGEIRVETLAESGLWFRKKFDVTPATCVVALNDWRNENRKTIWYDSRFYRMNLLWDSRGLWIRDLHRFDEKVVSRTHDSVLQASALACGTLPIVEGSLWSAKKLKAGAYPVLVAADGTSTAIELNGEPSVKELNVTDLQIVQPLKNGAALTIVLEEKRASFAVLDAQAKPMKIALEFIGGVKQKEAVLKVTDSVVNFHTDETTYQLRLDEKGGRWQSVGDGMLRVTSNTEGRVILLLGGY